MNTDRHMVCTACLKAKYGDSEKCCTHGLVLGGGYRKGACSDCGHEVAATEEDHLHCPDGPRP